MSEIMSQARGPLFDGRAAAAIDAFTVDAENAVAEAGVNEVRQTLSGSLKNPTGFYESQIQTERRADTTLVTDGGVVYGPWLEGTSSRNTTTRFKGYAAFRRSVQRVQAQAPRIAEKTLQRYLGRMG